MYQLLPYSLQHVSCSVSAGDICPYVGHGPGSGMDGSSIKTVNTAQPVVVCCVGLTIFCI